MTKAECMQVGRIATEAVNSISNISPVKPSDHGTSKPISARQQKACRALKIHISGRASKPIAAISTGNPGEVVIIGVGAVASCRGIKGTLKAGDRIMVRIRELNVDLGTVSVSLAENQ